MNLNTTPPNPCRERSTRDIVLDLLRIQKKLLYHRKEQRVLEILADALEHILRERAQVALLEQELRDSAAGDDTATAYPL